LPLPSFLLTAIDIPPASVRKASLRMSLSNPPDTAILATAPDLPTHTQRSARTLLQQQRFCAEHRYPQNSTEDP